MAILIKSMDMPTECEYCGFCRYYPENGNVWCNAKNRLLKMNWENPHWTHLDVKRPDWCPLEALPSAQPESLSDAYKKAVWTWLLDYQIKASELEGRYTPYEVLSWVANDWRKEHERFDKQTGGD